MKKRSFAGMSTATLMKKARRFEGRETTRIKRLVAASKEAGYFDVNAGSYVLDSTGSVTLLNPIPQGATVTSRVGKKIMLKSLQVRGRIANGSTAVINDTAYFIVYDKRPNGVLPAISDILTSASPSVFNNDDNAGRFVIIKRVDAVLIGSTTTPTEATAKDQTWYIGLRGMPTTYKSLGTGAIADIEEGALYLVTIGNTAAGTAAATLTAGFRTRFVDV